MSKRTWSYLGIILVVFVWGAAPLITKSLYDVYSAAALKAANGLFAALTLLVICRKKLHLIDKTYLKTALPCGLFYSFGEVLNKIGLQYTTPTTAAFLENLSCVAVPILLFILVRKKPTLPKLLAAAVCIGSALFLSMGGGGGIRLGVGELLCALAGISYGCNMACTSVYGKKLDSYLFVFIQMCTLTVVSSVFAVAMALIPTADGGVLEPIRFSFHPLHLLLVLLVAVFTAVICWLIRTAAMKYVDATVVAVIMPFSAVVTGILSVIAGEDTLSLTFILGAALGLVAALLSSVGDILEEKKKTQAAPTEQKAICNEHS